jgi:hypothetical protein
MADTFIKIATVTVGTATSSIDFTSIPDTYTDLVIKLSLRTNKSSGSSDSVFLRMNGDTSSSYSYRYLSGSGSAVSSASAGDQWCYLRDTDITSSTANTFGSADVYIPNYAGSSYKSVYTDITMEANATLAYATLSGSLWRQTSAITSLSIITTAQWVQYSTATLYGIKNS